MPTAPRTKTKPARTSSPPLTRAAKARQGELDGSSSNTTTSDQHIIYQHDHQPNTLRTTLWNCLSNNILTPILHHHLSTTLISILSATVLALSLLLAAGYLEISAWGALGGFTIHRPFSPPFFPLHHQYHHHHHHHHHQSIPTTPTNKFTPTTTITDDQGIGRRDCGTTMLTGPCSDRWHEAGKVCVHTLTCWEWELWAATSGDGIGGMVTTTTAWKGVET